MAMLFLIRGISRAGADIIMTGNASDFRYPSYAPGTILGPMCSNYDLDPLDEMWWCTSETAERLTKFKIDIALDHGKKCWFFTAPSEIFGRGNARQH